MKIGDRLEIEFIPYEIESIRRGRVTLKRRPRITKAKFVKLLKANRWRRLVSADFIVDAKTKETLHNYQMLALGIPSKRIEKLHQTLPFAEGN